MDLKEKIANTRHVWTFGCSFTKYHWKTWADHLSDIYGKVTNCGLAGAGNYYIFQRILQEYSLGNIDRNDLIMICWTGHFRKDNKFKGHWHCYGNLAGEGPSQDYWTKDFVTNYCDPDFFLERDLYFALAINEIFPNVINFSMGDIGLINQYENNRATSDPYRKKVTRLLRRFYPSFYEVLWNNDITSISNRRDKHPTEDEHKIYLQKVFNING